METANPLGVAVIMAMQKLLPVGSIIEWCPVDGGPDLSTPDKVAAYYGFGEWEAYGAGRSTVGADDAHLAGTQFGSDTHKHRSSLRYREYFSSISGEAYRLLTGLDYDSGTEQNAVYAGNDSEGLRNAGELGGTVDSPGMQIYTVNMTSESVSSFHPSVAVYRWRRIA